MPHEIVWKTMEKNDNQQVVKPFINLEELIASKNKKLLRFLPRFVLKWFKKLVHLDEINDAIYRYRDYKGSDFTDRVIYDELNVKLEVENRENIPFDKRTLIVANHPIGSIDGMALISIMGEKRSDLLFPVNDLLCALPGLQGVFVPINKYGKNSSNHDVLNEAFKGGACVMYFPAGTESKYIDGKFQDFPWKKTFVKKAIEFERDVTPVFIEGMNSKRFYRFSKIRRFFGIKFDLEMILLPDEMFRYRNKTIKLTFGKPIPYTVFDKSRTHMQWAQLVREHVYKLKDNPQAEFEPFK